MKLAVSGAKGVEEVPGLSALSDLEIAFAPEPADLPAALAGAEVLLGWNFRGNALADSWAAGDRLKWIHWCGAGVDATLFPELVASDVILTNARGLFDRAMAEYVLALILAQAKLLPDTLRCQSERHWSYRRNQRIQGARIAIFGVGSIGHGIARLLSAVGLSVVGVGRSARASSAVFERIYGQADALEVLGAADWVVSVMPRTRETEDYFGAAQFKAMKPSARFINLGRGASVDEAALVTALQQGWIAGAALDVFKTEPLPADDPLWQAPQLIVSPHMSGDYHGYESDIVELFLDNLARYRAGQPLHNLVDKQLGFVASS